VEGVLEGLRGLVHGWSADPGHSEGLWTGGQAFRVTHKFQFFYYSG